MFTNITVIGLGIIGSSFCRAVKHVMPNTHITGIDQDELIQEVENRLGRSRAASFDACRRLPICRLDRTGHADSGCPRPAAGNRAPQQRECRGDRCLQPESANCLAGTDPLAAKWLVYRWPPDGGQRVFRLCACRSVSVSNAIYVLCPAAGVPEQSVRKLADLVHAIGAHGVLVQPDEHDRIAAAVSHLPQMLAVALMRYLALKMSTIRFISKWRPVAFVT